MAYTPLKIHIPEPCHENWDEMVPVPGSTARHCDSCTKNVTDFTGFSDGQLHAYVRENKGKLCGRFRPDQLGRPMRASQQRSFNPLKIVAAAAGLMAMGTSCVDFPKQEVPGNIAAPLELPSGQIHPPRTGEISTKDVPATPACNLPTVLVEESVGGVPIADPELIPIPDNPFTDDMIMGMMIAPQLPEPTGMDYVKDSLKTLLD